MAITVKEDIVGGCRFRQDANGLSFIRKFVVSGIEGQGFATCPYGVLSPNTDIPWYGTPLPPDANGNNYGMVVNQIEAMPFTDQSRTGVSVTVIYGPATDNIWFWKVEISGSNAIKNIERYRAQDFNGKATGWPILVPYQLSTIAPTTFKQNIPVNPSTAAPPQGTTPIYYDYASVPALSPNTVVRFTKAFTLKNPIGISQQYRRMTNQKKWLNGEPGTWLCRDATANILYVPPQNSGFAATAIPGGNGANVYLMSFTFEWQPETWDRIEYFRSSIDGRIPTNINPSDGTNNGYINFPPYGTYDFGLPITGTETFPAIS